MIVQNFCGLLRQNGFTYLNGECKEITYWYRIQADTVYCFHVCDFGRGVFITENDLLESLQNMSSFFMAKGYYDIQKLTVAFTFDMTSVKQLMSYDSSHWIINLKDLQLIIYESQPADFCGSRQAVESFLEDMRVNWDANRLKPRVKLFSPVNTIIVLINVVVFIITELLGDTLDAYYMYECGAIYAPAIKEYGEVYRLVSGMFLHFGMSHLAGNMTVLLLLGDNLERALGKLKYVILYITGGICAGVCSVAYNLIIESNAVCAGASGAIFGVIGALLYIVWANKGRLEDISGTRLTISVAYMLYTGFTSQGIDNAAHIGGLIAGFLLGMIMYRRKNREKETTA